MRSKITVAVGIFFPPKVSKKNQQNEEGSEGGTQPQRRGMEEAGYVGGEGKRLYSFPFEPYEIQKDFMRELYKVLDAKKLGIFESPTGTVRIIIHYFS